MSAHPTPSLEEEEAELEKLQYRKAYGAWFEPIIDARGRISGMKPMWMIERQILNATRDWEGYTGVYEGERPPEYQGWVEHFMAFVSALWPHFEWNPNAEKIVRELFVDGRQFLGIAGHGSSGKTETLAYIAVALFLVDPANTMVICTSKTFDTAQKKIWGSVSKAWNKLKNVIPEQFLPGHLTTKAITYVNVTTGDKDGQRGLILMPGEHSQFKKFADKYQGIKSPVLMVAADELATISPAVVETAIANLTKGTSDIRMPNGDIKKGFFKFAGGFNPETHHDASRKVAMPKKGWGSITIDDTEWETEIGYCIRFDGMKSPNVLAGRPIWTGLYTRDMLEADLKHYGGEKTAGFWSMVRGFWPPMGIEDAIYSSQEIETYRGEWMEKKGFMWLSMPTKVAGLDPSFRPGGDRAILYFGLCGMARFDDGRVQMVFQWTHYILLAEDVTKAQDKSMQVALTTKSACEKEGVNIIHLGVDITGAAAFGSLLRAVWGDGFLEVNFAESASDAPISETDPRPAKDRYADRPSELWFSGKPLLRTEQLKGIHPDLAADLVSRSFTERQGKIEIESKEIMKKRIGHSPDIGDAGMIALDVARQRCGLVSVEKVAKTRQQQQDPEGDDEFMKWARKMHLEGRPSLIYDGATS
jgi:hypothetical protein